MDRRAPTTFTIEKTRGDEISVSTSNLPLAARKLGGAVVEVLEREEHELLSVEAQIGIALLIRDNPELNNEYEVDMIAGIESFFGYPFDQHIAMLIKKHSTSTVHKAFDLMREMGISSPNDFKNIEGRGLQKAIAKSYDELVTMIDALDNLAAAGYESAPEGVEYVIVRLGGLGAVADMPTEELADRLNQDGRVRYGEVPDKEAYY